MQKKAYNDGLDLSGTVLFLHEKTSPHEYAFEIMLHTWQELSSIKLHHFVKNMRIVRVEKRKKLSCLPSLKEDSLKVYLRYFNRAIKRLFAF
mmetsp:Transcript_1199/g.1706  ORF Transcript_1199/g.1706 Transcript_1199/m.1706 type:complete len:92 (-) Transcript_1199:1316-1591(-)